MEMTVEKPRFLEMHNVADANAVSNTEYRFLDYDNYRHVYVFKLREKREKKEEASSGA